MRILVQQTGSGESQLIELPTPEVTPGTVLVRNHYSVVSVGTEKAAIDFGKKSIVSKALERPQQVKQVLGSLARDGVGATVRRVRDKLDSCFAPGYSSAGTVIAVGEGVRDIKLGERVACAGAGYAVHAEHIVVPRNLVVPVPDAVDLSSASFTTLGSIALQGVRQAGARLGENVVVIGLGLLGQLTVQMLRASGVHPIAVDLDTTRVELARSAGAQAILRGKDVEGLVEEITGGVGADAVIITAATSSEDPIQLAGVLARERGRVVIVGAVPVNVPRSPYYEKELDVRFSRSYGPGRYDPSYEEKGLDYPVAYVRWTERRNMAAFVGLLESGAVDVSSLITHRFPFSEAESGYAEIMSSEAPTPPLGVVLEYEALSDSDQPDSRVEVPNAVRPVGGKVGVSIVGPGSFARDTLVPALKRVPVVFRGAVSSSGISARNLADAEKFAFVGSTIRDLLADDETHAVVVATPHHDHADLAAAGLEAGRAVFVEKPLALDRTSLDRVMSVAETGPPLMVGFNRRFAPATRKVREALDSAPGARVINIRVSAGRIAPTHWIHDPEIGGGRLLGEGCHFIDLAGFLAGSEPERVWAQSIRHDPEADLEDNFVVNVLYRSGSVASIVYTSRGDRSLGKERVEAFAGDVTAFIEDFETAEVWRNGSVERWKGKQDKGHTTEIEAFVKCVADGSPAPIPLSELRASSLATILAAESLRDGEVKTLDRPGQRQVAADAS